MNSSLPLPIVRYLFYVFIFAIPFETLDIGIERGLLSLSSLTGYTLIGAALLQTKVCFRKPPTPFWYFTTYLFVFICLGILQDSEYSSMVAKRVLTLVQMLMLLWIAFSLFQDRQIIKEAFLALGASCVLLSVLQIGGGAAKAITQGRVSALGEDANTLGSILSLGLLALLGLAYGRALPDGRIRLFAWMGFGGLAVGIVSAGSRGAFISLIAGILALITRPGQSAMRIKVALIALLTAGCLVWTAYQNDAVRTRWERTFSKGNMSGREKIVPVAWKMFSESPVIGWGTGRLTDELGRRFGKASVDTHNGYLWVLTETGLVGCSPFFVGLVLTWRAAWRARWGAEGSLPLALLTCVLLVNMSLTWHYRKLFWIVLAYALASNTSAALKWQRLRTVAHGSRTILPVGELDVPARR